MLSRNPALVSYRDRIKDDDGDLIRCSASFWHLHIGKPAINFLGSYQPKKIGKYRKCQSNLDCYLGHTSPHNSKSSSPWGRGGLTLVAVVLHIGDSSSHSCLSFLWFRLQLRSSLDLPFPLLSAVEGRVSFRMHLVMAKGGEFIPSRKYLFAVGAPLAFL